jgi:hypothetical protein
MDSDEVRTRVKAIHDKLANLRKESKNEED